ncbi:MAG: iron-containing alcohol dehydrogenase [Bacteroidales bacterium]|nr:iron-containing alcohol dehydrogenase [Bacteroidales bacterium]
MVSAFNFARLPLIYFGAGKLNMLIDIAKRYGNSALIVTGSRSFIKSHVGEALFSELKNRAFEIHHVMVSGEPSPAIVDNVVDSLKDNRVDVVVSVGGGSVIDTGKAISAMLPIKEPLKEYLEGVGREKHPGVKIPFIAVPTTAGTGSEATNNAVISEVGENGFKKSLRHDNFVPDVTIVDPQLTISCPKEVTAWSGMDCFTQLVEAYLSNKASVYTDVLSLEGIKTVKSSLIGAYQNANNIEARSGMSFAALTSGICLTSAGLGVVHGFASAIGAMYRIPHGIICGTLMAKANEINVRILRRERFNNSALEKYETLGRLCLVEENKSRDYYIDGFIAFLHELTEKLNMPLLGKFDVKVDDVKKICYKTEIKNNPVVLQDNDLEEILTSRI